MILFLHPVAKLLRAFLFYAETLEDAMLLATVAMTSFSGFSFLLSSNMSNQKCINCCNAQVLGLFISTYTSRTSVKSIAFSIVFASNSQNILNFIIFLSVFGFRFFINISIYQFLNLFNTFFCFSQKYQAVPVSELLNSDWIYFHIPSLFFYRIHHYKYHIL